MRCKFMKKFALLFILLFTISSIAFAGETVVTQFPDVGSDHWAYNYIMKMAEEGIVNGYTDHTFKPNNNITRAEFAKIFCLALDTTAPIGAFNISASDVSQSKWYYSYVVSCGEYIPCEDESVFAPDEYITREDAAYALVYRLFGKPSDSAENYDGLLKFNDFNDWDRCGASSRTTYPQYP